MADTQESRRQEEDTYEESLCSLTFLVHPDDRGAGGAVVVKVGPQSLPRGIDEERHQEDEAQDGENCEQHEKGCGVEEQQVQDCPADGRPPGVVLVHAVSVAAAASLLPHRRTAHAYAEAARDFPLRFPNDGRITHVGNVGTMGHRPNWVSFSPSKLEKLPMSVLGHVCVYDGITEALEDFFSLSSAVDRDDD